MDIITKFIIEHIEPLLKAQAIAGLSKTLYCFIPTGTKQKDLTLIMPENKNIVEGFGGNKAAGPLISRCNSKEYVKVIRLTEQEFSLRFWQQPAVPQELEQTLKSRLLANGEKLAKTTPNSVGNPWEWTSFVEGETLPPGYTAVELTFESIYYEVPNSPEVVRLFAEIA
jgi:hypothetical protein